MTDQARTKKARSTVAICRVTEYGQPLIDQAVKKQFDLLGGVDKFVKPGDRVLVKPNFIAPKPADEAVQTHPSVILATAKILKDYGANPFIADSPAWKNTEACINVLGLAKPLKHLGVDYVQLNKPKRKHIAGAHLGISSVALDADVIINLPKFKAHQQLGATFAIKNMFGCICGKEKAFRHFSTGGSYDKFCKMLLGIYEYVNPAVTIIDGVVALEGMGPISGDPKPLGFLIGSTDPIAAEIICCDIVGFDPMKLPIIRKAKEQNFGCSNINMIDTVGDPYHEHKCPDFKPAFITPLYFTFPRICKSLTKQIILRTKALFGK